MKTKRISNTNIAKLPEKVLHKVRGNDNYLFPQIKKAPQSIRMLFKKINLKD